MANISRQHRHSLIATTIKQAEETSLPYIDIPQSLRRQSEKLLFRNRENLRSCQNYFHTKHEYGHSDTLFLSAYVQILPPQNLRDITSKFHIFATFVKLPYKQYSLMQVMITTTQIITIVWNTRGYSNRLTVLMFWRTRTFYIKNAMPGTFLRYRNVKLSQISFHSEVPACVRHNAKFNNYEHLSLDTTS